MEKNSKIYLAGHDGLVGSSIFRSLERSGYQNIVVKTLQQLDLTNQSNTENFFRNEKPEYVFLAAAKVGGILANQKYPADFIYQNLLIEANVINAAYKNEVKKLLFLGSSCIYPKYATQPIKEEFLLEGILEKTNEPYAIAKIAGIKLCQSYNRQYRTNYISAMPTNLFGIHDNFDLNNSHVVPAMIRKFHEAKMMGKPFVTLWGTGKPKRELLYVEDLADACVFLMNNYDNSDVINIGTGEDLSIKDLALLIKKIVGYDGDILWDSSKPDGTPRKLLDVSRLRSLGWKHMVNLEEGLRLTYEWYKTILV
jgi:GDP-L-fucose synthase